MGVRKTILVAGGLTAILCGAWQLDAINTPAGTSAALKDANPVDAKLIDEAKHIAPFAYKAWLEEQARKQAQEEEQCGASAGASVAKPVPEQSQTQQALFGQPTAGPAPQTAQTAWSYTKFGASQLPSTSPCERKRVIVRR
jgi:hypothetical protein